MPRATADGSFTGACSLLESALGGTARHDILADASIAGDFQSALLRLRAGMRSNNWLVPADAIRLDAIVSRYDSLSRRDGFHAMHVWDEGDADENLDRVGQLLRCLQGPTGSGQQFVDDAETLLLIATSHYELYDGAYDRLLEKVRTLNETHRRKIALGHAASIGSHLRFGFEATYGRDTVNMRNDNVADYPWLAFSLATLTREYACRRGAGVEDPPLAACVEAILNGLSP